MKPLKSFIHNQDKIKLAIDELDKMKENFETVLKGID